MAGKKSITQSADEESARLQGIIHDALNLARGRLRRRAALHGLMATLWLPVLAVAGWAAAVRFTLLDLPRWPVAIILLAWSIAFFVWLRRLRVTQSQCAHYMDAALDLDERLITYVELEGRERLGNSTAIAGSRFKDILAADTAMLLAERVPFMSGNTGFKLRKWPSLVTAASVLVLVGAIYTPTQFDRIKSERDLVRIALDAQAQKLADLRAEIVARPDLPDALKQGLASELADLEKQLQAQQIDRAEALATIADAEQKIRSLAPPVASSDLEPISRAADLLKTGIVDATNASDPSQSSTGEQDEFSSTEEAIRNLKPAMQNLTTIQARRLASELERAANAAAPTDAQLAQNLQDAAAAVRSSDWEKAASALDEASKRFNQALTQQQMAQAVENTLSRLEDGRQNIATAGASANKRGQVGFRRGNAPQASAENSQAANVTGTPNAGGQSSSLINSRIGQNQAAYGVNGGGSVGSQQSGQPGAGNTNNGSSQSGGGGQGGQPTGNSGGAQQSGAGSGGGGGAGTGSQGSNLGRISGPIRGAGGTQNPTGDAQGYGVSADGSQGGQSAGPDSERVYIPGKNTAQGSGVAGQAAPEQDPAGSGLAGRAGAGQEGDAAPSGVGLGSINTINTPYTEVLGQYSEQAIQALDRAYVPPDAKEYVRDYFAELGR